MVMMLAMAPVVVASGQRVTARQMPIVPL